MLNQLQKIKKHNRDLRKRITELQAENEKLKELNSDLENNVCKKVESIMDKNNNLIAENLGQLNKFILEKRK